MNVFPGEMFECQVELVGPFEPTWINHRWRYYGRTYRSLRLLKSEVEYKICKTLASEIQKEINREVLKVLMGE